MTSTEPRYAELILADANGVVFGKLPPVLAGTPWWAEVESVVTAVREQHGVEATILRLLSSPPSGMAGGHVSYLAEVNQPVACSPCVMSLDEHPLRNRFANVGGPQADLTWALSVIAQHGLRPISPPVQIKTWNLSSLWRIPVANEKGNETAWLKAVPRFFQHEGALINALAASQHVPRLVGFEPGRLVMREIPGIDLFDASLAHRIAMIDALVGLQTAWHTRTDELFAIGLPDWRTPALSAAIASVFARTRPQLEDDDIGIIETFIANLENRFAKINACGMPDTLVHGDFHSGNVRGGAAGLTILDWGDAGVGHPLLDAPALLRMAPIEQHEPLRQHWIAMWRAALPNANPHSAWDLLKPIAAARGAVIYQNFLDNIEPSEHPYHRNDPRDALRRAATLLRDALA